ncbi:GntR family transcriptional regulator [Cupriavidus pauculus]|uniref:GntR family transcriptional regulator n=1 Tax=Cupriavidus pauculus TaxID=82633 RepID=UPI0021553996|nr:GntR family transcriptional regulator [Cupriavidus pauculus]
MRQVEHMILSGSLQPNDRLPSIACLVAMLRVSRNTVVGAYEGLTDAGLLRGEPGRGFLWRERFPARRRCRPLPRQRRSSQRRRHDHRNRRRHVPAYPRPPLGHAVEPAAAPDAARDQRIPIGRGPLGLRMQIADYLAATRALAVDPTQIVAGVQKALHLLAAHLVHHGDHVVVESPGCAGF